MFHVQSERYRAGDDRASGSVDVDSAASGSTSQAQDRGFTFGRLLNKPTMPLQLSRQRTESEDAETPTSDWLPAGEMCSVSMQMGLTPIRKLSGCEGCFHQFVQGLSVSPCEYISHNQQMTESPPWPVDASRAGMNVQVAKPRIC